MFNSVLKHGSENRVSSGAWLVKKKKEKKKESGSDSGAWGKPESSNKIIGCDF